jgi:FkbM family methyltransferase
VFDVGANVGVFSRYARELFPKALIVALEPHPENLHYFRKFTHDPNLSLEARALGSGPIFRCLGAPNGAGESYMSVGLGFEASSAPNVQATATNSILLGALVKLYLQPGMKSLLKVDCEGGENSIWLDSDSRQALRQMDYITMELHDYALTGAGIQDVVAATQQALQELALTHACERQGVYFWASKRNL